VAVYFCIDFNINFREFALSPTEQQNPEHVSTGDLAPKFNNIRVCDLGCIYCIQSVKIISIVIISACRVSNLC